MNIFFYWKDRKGIKEIITAPVDDLVLSGVTRSTCIELLQESGISVSERRIYMNELVEAFREGRVHLFF
jgi:branched-chain amino acid aminotransferase